MARMTMTREEVAALLGLRMTTLAAWACRGRGPKFTKRRNGRVAYRRADVEAWLADPAADEAARASASTTCPS